MDARVSAAGRGRLTGWTRDPLADVTASALVVTLALTVCCSVELPRDAVINGVSWFGVTRATLAPYAAGLLGAAWLLARAATALASTGVTGVRGDTLETTSGTGATGATTGLRALQVLRVTLRTCAVLMVVLLLTPYTVDTWFNWTHMTVGAALFLVQLLFAAWFWRGHPGALTGALLAVQFAAGVVALVSLPGVVDLLLYGQLAYQVAFAVLLVHAVRTLAPPASDDS